MEQKPKFKNKFLSDAELLKIIEEDDFDDFFLPSDNDVDTDIEDNQCGDDDEGIFCK